MGYRTERVLVLTAVLTLGLGLILAIGRGGLLAQSAEGNADPVVWGTAAALLLVAASGSRWLAGRPGQAVGAAEGAGAVVAARAVPLGAVLPTLTTLGFILFLQLFEPGPAQVVVLVGASASLGALFWSRAQVQDPESPYYSAAQAVLNVGAHLCAFLLFSTIYAQKVRSLYSATAVAIVGFLLLYEMLARDSAWHQAMGLPTSSKRGTIPLLAGAAGLALGEITWGLNYWAALTTLVGGAFLLVSFYVIYGIVSHYLDRTLTRRLMLEYGGVATVALLAVFSFAFLVTE